MVNNSKKQFAAWDALEKAGIPLELPEHRVGPKSGAGLTIRQTTLSYEQCEIRELRNGRVAYVLPTFIRRDEPGKIIMRDATLDVPWDYSVEWLEADTKRNPGWYTFSRDVPHQYPRASVLNHRLLGTLTRGQIREGLLLAVGKVRPPENHSNGEIIPICFSILDEWGSKPSFIFKMRLNRCHDLARQVAASPRGPIFSRRDSIKNCEVPEPSTPLTDEEIFQGLKECMDEISSRGRATAGKKTECES